MAELQHQGACVLRTPLLSFDVLRNGITRETIRRYLEEPIVREALYVASPTLDTAIDAWLANPDDPRARDVELIVVRYLSRMAARPTPFGLFSGCGLATISDRTSLSVCRAAECRRSSRLDMQYLSLLSDALASAPRTRGALRFRLNSSMVVNEEEICYVETKVDPKTRARTHQLVAAEPSEAVGVAIRAAKKGAVSRQAICDAILNLYASVTTDDAVAFIDKLVDAQFLVSNVQPSVTCEDPIAAFAESLGRSGPADVGAAHEETRRVVEGLSKARDGLRAIDADGMGLSRERYREIMAMLEALPVPPDPARLFQVDLFKPGNGVHIGERVVREVRRAITLIHRITPRQRSGAMHRFRQQFMDRYGEREVPLAEVLDEERGVGFGTPHRRMAPPSPLLANIVFSETPDAGEQGAVPLEGISAHDEYKLARLLALREDGLREWKLDAQDLEKLTEEEPEPLPDALAAMVSIAATSSEAIDKGDFDLHLHYVHGPSGASLLGRFCHGNEGVRALVERHVQAEERLRPDAVFAEVVHLPEGRTGNVLCRPVLREHEIPYLGHSGVAEERQIPIDDLRVSVRGGRVRLRSVKLGREVLPRLTSMQNHGAGSLAIYRFLGALQCEGLATGLQWSWGPLEDAAFLPRVSYGRFVLSLARWTLYAREVEQLANDAGFRQRRGLPRWVSVMEGDHLLPLDLASEKAGAQLVALARGRKKLRLQELFPEPERMCAAGVEGRYTHELVIPFVRADRSEEPAKRGRALASPSAGTPEARIFLPGSRWLYAKIYTGPATGDRLLRAVVAPLVRELRHLGIIERWFFIRYADPDFHLRLRFEGDPAQLMVEVLPRLQKALASRLASGDVVKLVLDTYDREVERYGGPLAMPLAERIFEADSDAALEIVERTAGDAGADARWRAVLRGMHALLGDAGIEGDARRALLVGARDAFAKEHRADAAFRKGLGTQYRAERAAIERIASSGPVVGESPGVQGNDDAMMSELLGLVEARSAAVAPAFEQLRALRDSGRLETSWEGLVASLIHMHVNRVIRADARRHEFVLYEYLLRAFDSGAARTAGRREP
ncbi:lantibiotic dehydratase [Pendulispora brunnea]|uniref:Lantibiotic dehydratase n=1 Tax=Pendulispora brunnea TaxID=2905690 RepID=A0ABZ2KEC6_9BACT